MVELEAHADGVADAVHDAWQESGCLRFVGDLRESSSLSFPRKPSCRSAGKATGTSIAGFARQSAPTLQHCVLLLVAFLQASTDSIP